MPLIILVLITAVAISCVAAFFSIVGLAALFAATATGVIVMAATLEVGKIVTTKLIHTLWRSKRATWFLKAPLMVMVASLMCVTSLGIYGYLSKGHLEQNAPIAGIEIQSEGLQRQVDQKNNEIKQLQTRLDQINANINSFLSSGAASKGLRASNQLKSERDQIQKQIDANNQEINSLSDKLVPLKTQASEVQAKLGPVKYVAALFGFQDPEVAVRIVILLIMVAFDPLAICLVIAASVAYDDYRDKKIEESAPEGDDRVKEETIRLAELNQELQNEVEKFKEELAAARGQIASEKSALDEKLSELEAEREAYESSHSETEKTATALAAYQEELEKREADLSDRIALLEKFFPAGTTDDQAIVALLEKNPNILQDIVEIIKSESEKGTIQVEQPAANTSQPNMIIKRPE